MDNKAILDVIKKNTYYTDSIKNSFNKTVDNNSYIFRRGANWYQFENWNLPESGLIREWRNVTSTCIPKKEYTENYNKANSKVIFDSKSFKQKFKYYKIRHITFSTNGLFFLVLLEKESIYDIVVVDKSTNIIDIVKNVSIEGMFFMNDKNILFCRDDDYGRPSKLFKKNIDDSEELLIYEEDNLAYRLKIIPTGSNDNACFVKTADFTSGIVFLFTFFEEEIKYFKLPNSPSGLFDILEINKKLYLITLLIRGTDKYNVLNFFDLENKNSFELQLETKRTVTEVICIGSHILLNTSEPFECMYTLIKNIDDNSVGFKEINLLFSQKVTLYENSFDDNLILFSEKNIFSETIWSYDIYNERLTKEFNKSFFKQDLNERYNYKLIWTEKEDREGIEVPISLLWKGSPVDGIPKNYPCVSYVYGAYGKNDEIEFDPVVLSIVDSGFLYVVVHVRGGGFLGGDWYRSGKEINKKNSIQDYINGIKFLINKGIVDNNKIGLISSSAGGVIAGSVLNMEKNLLKCMLLFSPFINPFDQLIYGSDPLAKTEISEWGDISKEEIRKYIRSYSPLQNIEQAKDSGTVVFSVLGQSDNYIDNSDVICWSKNLQKFNVESYVYLNPNAGHGGINSEDSELLINILSFLLSKVME